MAEHGEATGPGLRGPFKGGTPISLDPTVARPVGLSCPVNSEPSRAAGLRQTHWLGTAASQWGGVLRAFVPKAHGGTLCKASF